MLIKNDDSPVMFPVLHPYGHVAFQAQRGDVHTVARRRARGQARGPARRRRPRARARRAVEQTVEFAMRELGDEAWTAGMHPDVPETKVLDNPYTYTEWDAGSAQWKR